MDDELFSLYEFAVFLNQIRGDLPLHSCPFIF